MTKQLLPTNVAKSENNSTKINDNKILCFCKLTLDFLSRNVAKPF